MCIRVGGGGGDKGPYTVNEKSVCTSAKAVKYLGPLMLGRSHNDTRIGKQGLYVALERLFANSYRREGIKLSRLWRKIFTE